MTKRICIFCGAADGNLPAYREDAARVGQWLAERQIPIVYGGGSTGLMGRIADAALAAGGEVVGIMPTVLIKREVAHRNLSELHEVNTMHERKAMMATMSDIFLTLPGGFGTLDEIMEIITWSQLGFHRKPIGILNTAGYYDPLLTFIEQAVATGFIRIKPQEFLLVDRDPIRLLEKLLAFEPPLVDRWLKREDL